MAGVILGTASILSSSASLIASLNHLTSRLKSLSGTRSIEIREKDRRRLSALHRRIDALAEPLSFALVAVESFVGRDLVLYARRLVDDVEAFMDRELRFEFVDDRKALTSSSAETVEFYLNELQFVLVGLSHFKFKDRKFPVALSPQSLLRASHRISDHRNLVGDVLAIECADFIRLRVSRNSDRKFILQISDNLSFPLSLRHNFRSSDASPNLLIWDEDVLITPSPDDPSLGVQNSQEDRNFSDDEDDPFVLVEEEGRRRRPSSSLGVTKTETKSFEFSSCCSEGWSLLDVVYLLRLAAFENDTQGRSHLSLSDDTLLCLLSF